MIEDARMNVRGAEVLMVEFPFHEGSGSGQFTVIAEG